MFNPNTMVYTSPIERWFARQGVVSYHGQEMVDKCRSVSETLCKLDPENDEEIPEWAQKLLTCKFISAIGRFTIMKEHLRDISLIKHAKRNAADRLAKEKAAESKRSQINKEIERANADPSTGFEQEK